MTNRSPRYITYVEDAEEDSGSSIEGIEGTRKYAISEAPVSPHKERSNIGKSRGDTQLSHRRSDSSPNMTPSDSDDTPRSSTIRREERRREVEQRDREQCEKERRRRERRQAQEDEQQRRAKAEARAAKEREPKGLKKTRPTSLTHSKTQPVVQHYKRGHVEDPSCYGVQQPATSGSRPRAQTRPASFYAGQPPSKPPISHAGWHQAHPHPIPFQGGYAPPPAWQTGPSASFGAAASPASQESYFDNAMAAQEPSHSHLKNRFERPSSSMGFRQNPHPQLGYPQDDYEEDFVEQPRITRRLSRSQKQLDDDRQRMPPPPQRPQSALPPSASFRPPPVELPPGRRNSIRQPPSQRRAVGFADQQEYDDDDDDSVLGELFTDTPPESAYGRSSKALARGRRSSVTYESGGMDIMPARSRGRRGSVYAAGGGLDEGGASLEEDKYLSALQYQDDVSGGPKTPLTAETLRKANKRGGGGGGGSSRSTRSSASRDESDYKRGSNTTALTRSSSGGNDDVTIKLSGGALVRVQGAEIECADGGEITFSTRPAPVPRASSDRASSVYQLEDSRSRMERKALPHRPRAPSQSDSQSRGYAPSYYGTAPDVPGMGHWDY